jgi:hypothetical protein
MAVTEPIFMKLELFVQLLARNLYTEFHEDLTNRLVVGTRSQTDLKMWYSHVTLFILIAQRTLNNWHFFTKLKYTNFMHLSLFN